MLNRAQMSGNNKVMGHFQGMLSAPFRLLHTRR
jgi:hypothetical protein